MFRAVIAFSVIALATSLGCSESEADACSDDQVYDDGACVAKPTAAAGSATSEGGAATSEGGAAGNDAGAPAAAGGADFGADCATHADCQVTTDYCAMSPVAPPYCTASGCDEAPELCPEGWSCFDVSQFASGEPWICMQP